MNVRILQQIQGAKQATGLAVIIDVFRAFTVEPYIMTTHPKALIAVGDKDIAYNYKANHPDAVLVGERQGIKLPNFDYGNSPKEVSKVDFADKTVLHTTSAGTQGIANATKADEIITGSLVNADAIARYIKRGNYQDVSLVCMGLWGEEPCDEDTLCAEYIASLLQGKTLPNLADRLEALKESSGKKFFDPNKQEYFAKEDFYMSTEIGKFDFVLKVNRGEYDTIERIDVKR